MAKQPTISANFQQWLAQTEAQSAAYDRARNTK